MAKTKHNGIVPSDEADKLYSYPVLNNNAGYDLRGDGSWGFHYATCETAANDGAKVVNLTGFKKTAGNWLFLLNRNSNTADTLTLNVNNTGAAKVFNMDAKEIAPSHFVKGFYSLVVGNNGAYFTASTPVAAGTYYAIDGMFWNYQEALSRFFLCSTAADVAVKEATGPGVATVAGMMVNVFFSVDNTATNITLKLNSLEGYWMCDARGNRLSGAMLGKGMHTFVFYNGIYYDIGRPSAKYSF